MENEDDYIYIRVSRFDGSGSPQVDSIWRSDQLEELDERLMKVAFDGCGNGYICGAVRVSKNKFPDWSKEDPYA